MKEKSKKNIFVQDSKKIKKVYQKPLLKKHGDIAKITACSGGDATDVFFAGSLIC